MRLWSIHPKYLDTKGLLALWREGLLAKKVLEGNTKGYKNHPQLSRFKASPDPIATITEYLREVTDEARRREYRFDESKLGKRTVVTPLTVTEGQIAHERRHLLNKLLVRSPMKAATLPETVESHPLFAVVEGPVEPWEKLNDT